MNLLSASEIDRYATIFATSFLDDPRTVEEFRGIANPLPLLTEIYRIQIKELMQEGMVYPLDTRGILIGYRSTQIGRLRLLWRLYRMGRSLENVAGPEELKLLRKNERRISPVDKIGWYRKYAKTKDYFHIMDLAIAPDARGSGAFREMITPVLEQAQQQHIPAVLETHNPPNVPLYEHFGFQVVHVFETPKVPFKQWCMVKFP